MSHINFRKFAEIPDLSIPPQQAAAQEFSKNKPAVVQPITDVSVVHASWRGGKGNDGEPDFSIPDGWDGRLTFSDGKKSLFRYGWNIGLEIKDKKYMKAAEAYFNDQADKK